MRVLETRNVHQILPQALEMLSRKSQVVVRDSRNGPVVMSPVPVTTVYHRPDERVLFHEWRDANPFFHFYESLWMLAGRRDVAPVARYVKRMADFSDDGEKFNAAYGHRWRHAHAGRSRVDQLASICEALTRNPDCRRQVLQIWDTGRDLNVPTKDAACNVTATFQIGGDGKLDLTVFCRSNDVIMGCYGANAVHYSVLHEYVARSIGAKLGRYSQISVNWHAYRVDLDRIGTRWTESDLFCPYSRGQVEPYPLMQTPREEWDRDVRLFVTRDGRAPDAMIEFRDPFFQDVAMPIVRAHDVYKDHGEGRERFDLALLALQRCKASDWKKACDEWLRRKRDAYLKKEETK